MLQVWFSWFFLSPAMIRTWEFVSLKTYSSLHYDYHLHLLLPSPSLTQSLSPLPSWSRWLVHCRTSEVFSREKGTVFVLSAAVLQHQLCVCSVSVSVPEQGGDSSSVSFLKSIEPINIYSIFYSVLLIFKWYLLLMGSWLYIMICSLRPATSVHANINQELQ